MAKKSRSRTPQVPKVTVAPASPDGPNRKIRKEEARRQREALQRRAARRRFYRWGVVALIVVAALGTGTALVIANNGKGSGTGASPTPSVLPDMQTGQAPWTQGIPGLKDRLTAIGVPFGPQETLAYHIHDLIQIFVDGKPVTIPAGIGINNVGAAADQFIAALHTHDASGIVHIESPDKRDYTLGQFFTTWGVRLTSTCLGDVYCNSGDQQLRVYVDGNPYTKDPTGIVFSQHHDIVITFGTKAQLPKPIPSTYSASLSPSCASQGQPATC